MNHLKELEHYGQSVWLDYIRRNMFSSGELKRYVEDDGLKGMTSNPAIFEKAITGSDDYSESLKEAQAKGTSDPMTLFETLAVPDIQQAADVLSPVYQQTKKLDGYVSLEVSPYRARDTQGTLADARRLWKDVSRPNLMVKVPGTPEGIPAIEQLISEGININVTLLFSNEAYERVAEAYLAGLERREGDLSGIGSVASFFVSRIDVLIDGMLQKEIGNMSGSGEEELRALAHGQSGHSQRETCLRDLQENLLRAALGKTQSARRAAAASALGQHQHQEPRISRCACIAKSSLVP